MDQIVSLFGNPQAVKLIALAIGIFLVVSSAGKFLPQLKGLLSKIKIPSIGTKPKPELEHDADCIMHLLKLQADLEEAGLDGSAEAVTKVIDGVMVLIKKEQL